MKSAFLIMVFVFSILMIHAQHDVIYPEIGKTSIRKCTITNVTKGNVVHYVKDSLTSVIEAVAIKRDGKYMDLYPEEIDDVLLQDATYEDKSYNYYKKQYNSAIKARNIGIGLTIAGLGAGVIGGLTLGSGHNDNESKGILTILYIGGGVLTNAGIILWIAEGSRAANNYRAMKRARNNVNLSLGFTNNGIGLHLTFNN